MRTVSLAVSLAMAALARPGFCENVDPLTLGVDQMPALIQKAQMIADRPLTVALFGTIDPYSKLKEFYEKGTDPVNPTDFSMNANDHSQVCESVSKGRRTFVENYIRRVATFVPGETAHGPLFPGSDSVRSEKVVFWNGDQLTEYHIRPVINERVGKHFVIKINKTPAWKDSPIAIKLIKNQNLIAYHGVTQADDEHSRDEFYGYCYPNK